MADYLRVRAGYMRDGRVVKGGEVIAANDPLVKGVPAAYFEPLDDVVEQATRRPGERRILPGRARDVVLMKAEQPRGKRTPKAEDK